MTVSNHQAEDIAETFDDLLNTVNFQVDQLSEISSLLECIQKSINNMTAASSSKKNVRMKMESLDQNLATIRSEIENIKVALPSRISSGNQSGVDEETISATRTYLSKVMLLKTLTGLGFILENLRKRGDAMNNRPKIKSIMWRLLPFFAVIFFGLIMSKLLPVSVRVCNQFDSTCHIQEVKPTQIHPVAAEQMEIPQERKEPMEIPQEIELTEISPEAEPVVTRRRPLTINFNEKSCTHESCTFKGSMNNKCRPGEWLEIAHSKVIRQSRLHESSTAELSFTWKNSQLTYWDRDHVNHLLRIRLLEPCTTCDAGGEMIYDGISYKEVASSPSFGIAPGREETVHEYFDMDQSLVRYGLKGSMYTVEIIPACGKGYTVEVKDFQFRTDSSFVRESYSDVVDRIIKEIVFGCGE